MTPRSGRASMREGPLSNLFRSTESPRNDGRHRAVVYADR